MLMQYKAAVVQAAVVQAAPEFLDLEKTVDKGISLIREAADNGAKIIGFPESWIPGYPWWIWLDSPADGLRFVQQYHENSLQPDSPAFDRIRQAARDKEIYVVMGASERARGSLYLSQFFIDDTGALVSSRRKLKPTHVERTVYGDGYGNNLQVLETGIGRLGGLYCWEHLQPLSKYALYSQQEQIHVGAWPSFSLYPGRAYSLGAKLNMAVSSVYAAEGQCYFLAACGVISPEMVERVADTPPKRELLKAGGGHAMIFAPDGSPMCAPIPEDEEGILYADIDLGAISIAKSFADPAGHYSRPDVTRLVLDNSAVSPVEILDSSAEVPMDDDAARPDDEEENTNMQGAS